MAWVLRIVISAMAAIVSGISTYFGIMGISIFYRRELSQLPPAEDGDFGEMLVIWMSAITGGLLAMLILFLLFLTYYKQLNLLGLLLGAGFGFWFIRLAHFFNVTYIVSYENREAFLFYFNTISIVCLLLGVFFLKRDTKRFSRAGTVFGAAVGFLGSFAAVIGWRWLDNTLTSYFYFDSTENMIVLVSVPLFAVIGNIVGKKYPQLFREIHEKSTG